ncbi:MAG: TMEM165/GDT1 family protein [Betaproteobacteria bacterium]|nr:TMEM165/GDT1 family protein [Betaproteobacteria bacterium]
MTTAFLMSTLIVAIAEVGDKTQLLSLLLATRFRKPLPIVAGIALATLANHALAALAGEWVRAQLGAETLRWTVGLSMIAIGAWALKPDRLKDGYEQRGRWGVFAITCVAFFLVEIGDKTQIATVVLAAQYHALAAVVLGTTTGMLLANAPVVVFAHRFADRIPLKWVRLAAAALFAALGALALAGVGVA